MPEPRIAVATCAHDDHYFLSHSLRSFADAGDLFAFVSTVPWNGETGNWELACDAASSAGAEVIRGEWPAEILHRSAVQQWLLERGYTHALLPDGDEIAEPLLIDSLVRLARSGLAQRVLVHMDTYWKDPDLVIRPRERLCPLMMIELGAVVPLDVGPYNGRLFGRGKELVLPPEFGILHHLSYCGPDERILRKTRTWSHAHEVEPDWFRRVWKGFDFEPMMRELHPTHPFVYGWAERISTPECLADVPRFRPAPVDPPRPKNWPKVSIVIPLYGGVDDIKACLGSLEASRDLLADVIVVDDVSPDAAAAAAEAFEWTTVLRNERNLGFAGACNRGFYESKGDVVVFLNSDTIVPRAGLIRLIESLMESGTVGAVGPHTNCSAYFQPIQPTYTDVANLDPFARDFAHRDVPDREVPILVGFCVASRRSTLEEVGGPFDEGFGRGTYEDNDLSYRLLRAGYRLKVAARSYVHHSGHKSLARMEVHPDDLLFRNESIYRNKWREDLESGFASHLSGDSPAPIVFDQTKRPENQRARRDGLRRQADISLCMIVRNEERVLGDCLKSVAGVFSQVVVVDTGSTDRTREIAQEHDAELHEFPWTESFSDARNESLRHAKGRWVMWMDADDTLPASAAGVILNAAITAPDDVVGFVIPVRFVDGGPAGGTQVDHVKLFRNLPGIRFEGRIHEQILGSLRGRGEIARLDGAVVLHSGYDTSAEGQARKRLRDDRLLKLDLEERPDHPFVLFNLGMTAHYNGEHAEAVEWLRKSIAAAGPGESHVRKAYALMGVSLREQGQPNDALATFDEGLATVGPDPELHFQAAVVLSSQGRLEEARARYLAMPLDVGRHFSSIDVSILGPKRAHNLGTVCAALGRNEEAITYLRDGTMAGFSPSALSLFELSLEKGDLRTAQDALEIYKRLEGFGIEYVSGMTRLLDAKGENAEGFLRHLVDVHSELIPPRLTFCRRLLQQGREQEAYRHLLFLEEKGVAEAAFYLGVSAIRRGDLEAALLHTRRAHEMEPTHQPTLDQLERLERALQPAPVRRARLLTGPFAGELGPGDVPLSVVVVTFHSENFVTPCAEAVLAQLGPDDELIFVDNASPDGTRARIADLRARDSRVRVIENAENVGYARAANQGARASRGRNLVFLNPDAILSPGALEGMLSVVGEGVGAVGPLSDGVHGNQFIGLHLPENERPSLEELPSVLRRLYPNEHRPTQLLMGLCLLLPREIADRHGLFFEGCALGADDLEICWRLSELGYSLRIALSAFVTHYGSASFSTLAPEERKERIRQSDAALLAKLREYYSPAPVPDSRSLWGTDIFAEAQATL